MIIYFNFPGEGNPLYDYSDYTKAGIRFQFC